MSKWEPSSNVFLDPDKERLNPSLGGKRNHYETVVHQYELRFKDYVGTDVSITYPLSREGLEKALSDRDGYLSNGMDSVTLAEVRTRSVTDDREML